MEKPSAHDHAWNTIASTTAPPPILYLDTLSATDFGQFYKRQSFEFLDVKLGHCVLDVGCGPGDDVRALAQHTGESGKVVGVDFNAAMIQKARQRSGSYQFSTEFCHGDAHALAFADASFEHCRTDRVFQHLQQPRLALQEMVRVSRSGGRIAVSEPDWETLILDSDERTITRRIVNFICDQIVRNGWIGRQLPRLFKECGLTEVAVTTGAFILTDYVLADRLWGLERNALRTRDAGIISEAERVRWVESLRRAAEHGYFLGTASGFGVCGVKS